MLAIIYDCLWCWWWLRIVWFVNHCFFNIYGDLAGSWGGIDRISDLCSIQWQVIEFDVVLVGLSIFADEAEIQLIHDHFAWNATMVQAKTLKFELFQSVRLTLSYFDHPCVWSVFKTINHSIQHFNQQQPSLHDPSNKQTLHSEYQKHSREKEERGTMRYQSVFSLILNEWFGFDDGSVWLHHQQQQPTERT